MMGRKLSDKLIFLLLLPAAQTERTHPPRQKKHDIVEGVGAARVSTTKLEGCSLGRKRTAKKVRAERKLVLGTTASTKTRRMIFVKKDQKKNKGCLAPPRPKNRAK